MTILIEEVRSGWRRLVLAQGRDEVPAEAPPVREVCLVGDPSRGYRHRAVEPRAAAQGPRDRRGTA